MDLFAFDLPSGSTIYGDKKNSKRPLPPWERYLQARSRKIVETAVSNIERLLPKHIHAVTPEGFELKVVLFILAASFNALPI